MAKFFQIGWFPGYRRDIKHGSHILNTTEVGALGRPFQKLLYPVQIQFWCVFDHYSVGNPSFNCWFEVAEEFGGRPSSLFHPLHADYQYHWQSMLLPPPGRYSLVWKPHLYCSKHLVSSKHKTFFQEAANPVELESVDFGADSSFSFSTLSAHRGLVSSGLQAWALLVCELLPNSQTNFLSCENNSLGLLPELGKQCHIWITCLCTTVWTNLCKPTVLLLRSLPSSLDFHIVLSQSSGCYERNAFYGNSKGKPALVDHDQQQELNRPGSCQAERRIFSTIY